LSFDYIVDYLLRRRQSHPATLDPVGDFNLGLAKKVRRMAMRERALERPELLQTLADDFFPLPSVDLGHWRTLSGRSNGALLPG
jgi:hypothetical protein